MLRHHATALCWLILTQFSTGTARGEDSLRIATFAVDASPPIGSPVAYALTKEIVDPLSARGIVILSNEKPIVLCAVDWIGIAGEGLDAWQSELARAANTTPDRVTVHALHQHDGARCDFGAERLLEERGLGGHVTDVKFARATIARAAKALGRAIAEPGVVTHLGIGRAKVEQVASQRRILGPDGKVQITRWSRSSDPAAIAAPEGLIDPYVQLLALFEDDTPLAVLTYYATHPMSHYGEGYVSCDFVGIARDRRQEALAGVPHIHFNGAGGNITAGKYNDGSPERRPVLAARLEAGMKAAWEALVKSPIHAADVRWSVERVQLPLAPHLDAAKLRATLDDETAEPKARRWAAAKLSWVERATSDHRTEIACLRIGGADVLHMPGELFVEYQLAAQAMRPDRAVMMAAYRDYAPGYIGTEVSYTQGGYETSPAASLVAPSVERVLMDAMRKLLGASERESKIPCPPLDHGSARSSP